VDVTENGRLAIEIERHCREIASHTRALASKLDMICGGTGTRIKIDELSKRAFNVLSRAGITTSEQLADTTVPELLGLKNCGWKTVEEIREMLKTRGTDLKGCKTHETLPQP
jgi:DNA-directed RNA polymerase alpha subunit